MHTFAYEYGTREFFIIVTIIEKLFLDLKCGNSLFSQRPNFSAKLTFTGVKGSQSERGSKKTDISLKLYLVPKIHSPEFLRDLLLFLLLLKLF